MSEPQRSSSEIRSPQGLLYVEVDCPLELEAEFHAWYNTEHVPERLRIPGFVSGERYAALEGAPRWLASYGLESVAVLESPEYLKWAGPLQTAWTKRMVTSTRVLRSVFRLVQSADAQTPPRETQSSTGLVAVRYQTSAADRDKLDRWHDGEFCRQLLQVPGVRSVRRYSNTEKEEQLCLYALDSPWIVQEAGFARAWTAGWESRKAHLPAFRRTLYVRIL